MIANAATVFLLVAGCFFVLLGSLALVKLSSFFHRVHGPTKASTLGVGCILLASILYHATHGVGLQPRELLITVFLFLTAPVAAHMMSRAALSLMDNRPKDPSTTPDPEGHIRDDADERADQRERERREDAEEARRKTGTAPDTSTGQ
ncbi:Na+/H+ antiporter subunit G [Luteimonas aestuarii]|uniref:Na+/H+ antiporter subunit G n=2 Tax=Luteimonas aestuarii TaxID=453837 RepID=A0A4R5TTX0_9GAMM|nr:Na+/H+ antiporter subunit G [Luteimonas aestuarii]